MVTDLPSIRGAALLSIWSEVHGLMDQEMISREELMLRLGEAALVIVEGDVEGDLWYPIEAAEQLAAILVEFRSGGDFDYLVELGNKGLTRAIERGDLDATPKQGREDSALSESRLPGIAEQLFNFGRWAVSTDEGGLRIEVSEAEPLGELLCWVVMGHAVALGSHLGEGPAPRRLDRSDPSRLVFRSG